MEETIFHTILDTILHLTAKIQSKKKKLTFPFKLNYNFQVVGAIELKEFARNLAQSNFGFDSVK